MAGAGFFRGSVLQRQTPDMSRGLPKCGICKFAPNCVSPRMEAGGSATSGVLLVGEAPGEDEDRQGKHFVGLSGVRLRSSLKEIGQRFKDSHYTYAMICKPPTGSFTDVNINACRPSLLKTIDELKPSVIILLGNAPVRSLIPAERGGAIGGQDRWVGYTIPSAQHKAWLCPTYSPSQILRSGEDTTMLKIWHNHLRQAYALANKTPRAYTVKELWDKVELIYSPRQARQRLRDLAKKEGVLAFDYEANSLKPDRPGAKLAAVSFCLNGEDTFSLPIKNDETLKAISPVLRSKRLAKVASNLKNEERWTFSKLGHRVRNWYWDTMLAAHVLDNRKAITSIKFQAFIHFGVADYNRHVEAFFETDPRTGFNKIFSMDLKDLLQYNALDSLLEYMVSEKQREAFGYAS